MSKRPSLPKLLWHKLECYGVVSLFLVMFICLLSAVGFASFGVLKVAGACMVVAGVALLAMLVVFNEKEKK